MNIDRLVKEFDLLGDSPNVIQQFRKLSVGLAVTGRLNSPDQEALDPEALAKAVSERKSAWTRARVTRTHISLPEVSADDLPRGFTNPRQFAYLGSIARIEKGPTGIMRAKAGPYPLVVTAEERASCDHYDFEGSAAIVPLVSSAGHGKASLQRLHYQEGKFALGSILAAIFPYAPELLSARFLYEYLTAFKEELLVSRMIGTANVSLSVEKVSKVPVPLVGQVAQRRLDDLMILCDRLEAARAEREAARDRLTVASLERLTASEPDPIIFAGHARFVLDTLPALTARPDQIRQLRQTILSLALQGKLVPQDPKDERASDLLKRIAAGKAERKRTTADARIRMQPDPSPNLFPMVLPPGWVLQSFENLFLFIDYRGRTPPKTNEGVPLITAKNIRMGRLHREPREYISEKTFKEWMIRGFPKIGDLLFTTEAPLANVCLNNVSEPFALAQRAICLQPYAELDTKFLMFALMSDPMQSLIDAHATGTTARGIKAAKLKPLPIPIPPLAEQHRIVAKVDDLMGVCDRLEADISSAEKTRQRLLDSVLREVLQPGSDRWS